VQSQGIKLVQEGMRSHVEAPARAMVFARSAILWLWSSGRYIH
jgi:hypothetical protein